MRTIVEEEMVNLDKTQNLFDLVNLHPCSQLLPAFYELYWRISNY